ncbi:MAG: MarR family winged helix-turn-helix transcriptional regulator [Chloroflexota bacterium]|nr:MarR family winged helix-turn-helix transcriptional regulator [Chloroflexota bacterium]
MTTLTPSSQQIQDVRNASLGRLYLRAVRDFQTRSQEKLNARGYGDLLPGHMNSLIFLDVKGTRINTLAERAEMTKQAMGQAIQELEERGYVSRAPDLTDKRAALILFTEKGHRFLHDAYEIKQEIEAEYVALIGADGLAMLRDLLARVLVATPHEPME